MTLFAYEQERCLEVRPKSAAEVAQFREKHPVIWLNVDGLGDLSLLQELARLFHLHPLAMEDVVNTHQRSQGRSI